MPELPSIVTPCTAREMEAAVRDALAILSVPITPQLVAMLVAHSSLETGEWTLLRCFNFGNAKATSRWVDGGGHYTYFVQSGSHSRAPVSENLTAAQVQQARAQSKPRPDGQGPDMLVGRQRGIKWYCEFWPKHPQARFRAFETLAEGAFAFVSLLVRKYRPAIERAKLGDVGGYVNELVRCGPYFTAGRSGYMASLISLYRRYREELMGESELSDTGAFRSNPDDCAVDPESDEPFFELSSGLRMTCHPIVDTVAKLWARLGHGPASEWLKAHGMRLPTSAEHHELFAQQTVHIDPYTMPTKTMLLEVGVPLRKADINRYRNIHMMSHAWCAQHDAEVRRRLSEVGYESGPVANVGKHWTAPIGTIEGWWYANGHKIQSASRFHAGESTFVDYATLFHGVLIEDDEKPTPEPEPPSSEPVHHSTIRRGSRGMDVYHWQTILSDDGRDLGPCGADGVFGTATDLATRGWQIDHQLTVDGIVGPQTWASAPPEEPIEPPPEPEDTVGRTALAVAREEQERGVKEIPGRAAHPAILDYFACCERGGVVGAVALRSDEEAWCAAGFSWCQMEALQRLGLASFMRFIPRAAVWELHSDAVKRGDFHTAAQVRSGAYTPQVGDAWVQVRSGHLVGSVDAPFAHSGGLGHVGRVARIDGEQLVTLDANINDTWTEVRRSINDTELIGFISFPSS